MKASAVVDTSFWSAACHLGLDGFLYELFARPLFMPAAVIDELFRQPPGKPRRIYPYQQRLKIALEDGRVARRDPVHPHSRYGLGERSCIGLAKEKDLVLLINDYRPYVEARRLGISVMSMPELVVTLAAAGIMAEEAARNHLGILRERTSDALIDATLRILDNITRKE